MTVADEEIQQLLVDAGIDQIMLEEAIRDDRMGQNLSFENCVFTLIERVVDERDVQVLPYISLLNDNCGIAFDIGIKVLWGLALKSSPLGS